MGKFNHLLIREGMQDQEETNSQEQPWGKHTTISLSYFADTEIPSRWEKLMITFYAAHKHVDPRPVGPEG